MSTTVSHNTLNFFLVHFPKQNHPPLPHQQQKSRREKCCYSFLLFLFSHMWTWTVCPVSVLGSSSMLPCNLRSTPYWWSSHIWRAHWWCNITLHSTIAGRMTASAISIGRSSLLRKQWTLICSVTLHFSRGTAGIKAGAGYSVHGMRDRAGNFHVIVNETPWALLLLLSSIAL